MNSLCFFVTIQGVYAVEEPWAGQCHSDTLKEIIAWNLTDEHDAILHRSANETSTGALVGLSTNDALLNNCVT